MGAKNLMVIDDSEAEHFLVRIMVSQYDKTINVIEAYDGKEALDILSEMAEPPQVLLLDINMPRMSGMEFLEKFNEIYSDSKVKIAMFSSSSSEKEKAYEYNCVFSYFEKPLTIRHLEAMTELFKSSAAND